jgi:hypothetical protein
MARPRWLAHFIALVIFELEVDGPPGTHRGIVAASI